MTPRGTGAAVMAAVFLLGAGLPVPAAEPPKRVIGAVEEVWLVPWGLAVRARVDTGAELSSLDARDVVISDSPAGRSVRFTLAADGSRRVQAELPLASLREIRTPGGPPRHRPAVQVPVCLAGARVTVELTLNDRGGLVYRMLIGRDLLANRFVVDVARQLTAPSGCAGDR